MYKIENPVSADACVWCMYVLVDGGGGGGGCRGGEIHTFLYNFFN
jgi:hypothetical protein